MKVGVIQFPGSNCERETMLAIKRAGMEPVECLWNESHDKLSEMQGYVIVGGFSYEDRSRAGIMAALDPVMLVLKAQSELGKPILGICNGAQILVETGLVPGLENNKVAMVLAENKRVANGKILGTGFYNAWVHMRLADNYQRNAFTRHLTPKQILHVPVAHGEGRFVMENMLLQEIKHQGLNLFQYCDENGEIIDCFPINPNGSMDNIAAISNKAGNVMAMMPHPERTENGDAIFKSMHDYIESGAGALARAEQVTPLHYYPRRPVVTAYSPLQGSYGCVVELMIADNQALSVQNTLRQLGFPVTVKRQIHWEVECDSPAVFEQIKRSGVLFNERKEVEVAACPRDLALSSFALLVRPKEDLVGQQAVQTLEDHFAITGIRRIHHSILWHISSETTDVSKIKDPIIHTNILMNPTAHDCYQYSASVT